MHDLRAFAGLLFACLLMTTLPIAEASAVEIVPRSSSLALKGEAPMPAGYLALCQTSPRLCNFGQARKRRGLEVAPLTAARFRELQDVTTMVNRSMRAVEDRARFGIADRWTVGGGTGDCEDFAMTKRRLLMARGWPAAAVLVAIVSLRGAQHAVLVARTDGGDFVLDNLNSSVTPWRNTSYVWKKIQGPDAFGWRAL
jgi:predicted transglutaminase-like cysteine proteinase